MTVPYPSIEKVVTWGDLEELTRDLNGAAGLLNSMGFVLEAGSEINQETLGVVEGVLRDRGKRLQAILDKGDEEESELPVRDEGGMDKVSELLSMMADIKIAAEAVIAAHSGPNEDPTIATLREKLNSLDVFIEDYKKRRSGAAR